MSLPLNNEVTDEILTQTQDQNESAFDGGTADHEYFASSVEEINIGRDDVTSLATDPPHVFDIVWNMDLNTALDAAGIRVPYQQDVDEQEHKAGTGAGAYWYELATDNFGPIEIECLKVPTAGGTGFKLTYANYTGTVSREGNGSTEEEAMADLAKQLRVDDSDGVVFLNGNKSEDVGSTISVVVVAKPSTGIGNSFSDGAQDAAIEDFETSLKVSGNLFDTWQNDFSAYNSRNVVIQVKSGLAQLFDRKPELNNLLGSAASASTFLDSEKIAIIMRDDNEQFYTKLFSQDQLKEVLEAVADKGSRIAQTGSLSDRRYAFKPGDSITAVVKVKDGDAGGFNSDRWLITLQQRTEIASGSAAGV